MRYFYVLILLLVTLFSNDINNPFRLVNVLNYTSTNANKTRFKDLRNIIRVFSDG